MEGFNLHDKFLQNIAYKQIEMEMKKKKFFRMAARWLKYLNTVVIYVWSPRHTKMVNQAIIIIKALEMHHKLMIKNNKVTVTVKKKNQCENIIPKTSFPNE